MRVAALYDVHGLAPALEAVLADVARADVDAVVFGGDLIWGPWPRECLELARSAGSHVRFVLGNTDREALTDKEDPSAAWVQDRLTHDERAFVLAWPLTVSIDDALFCHATPRSDEEVVTPISPEERWQDALRGVAEHTVVCGHIHFQYDEEHAGHRVVNPGSIGRPNIRAAAWWAVVGDEIELRTTEYDVARTIEAVRAGGFPRPEFADDLESPPAYERLLTRWR